MGMYTELKLGVELKKDEKMLEVLNKMINDNIYCRIGLPDHPFFKTSRAFAIFHCGSYYFDSKPFVELYDDGIRITLTTCFNMKNYDSEIEKFLDWLCPYIETIGYLGTYWYEEDDYPKNIFKEDGKIKIISMQRGKEWIIDDK